MTGHAPPTFTRVIAIAAILIVLISVPGCSARDAIPMRNPVNGAEVTCYSGPYDVEEGAPQVRILEQCI